MKDYVVYMHNGILYNCPVTIGKIGVLYPKEFEICEMHRLDDKGKRIPFVVVHFYDSKGNFFESVPYFDEYLTREISHFLKNGKIPEEYYVKGFFRYVTIHLPFDVYPLYNYTDLKRNNLGMDFIYKPKMANGKMVTTNKVVGLQKMFQDNEDMNYFPQDTFQDVFYSYFGYCYDIIPGERRRLFESFYKN